MKKSYTKEFKRKVALAAIKEEDTLSELSSKFKVPSKRISIWKSEALAHLGDAFDSPRKSKSTSEEEITKDDLFKEIGQLKMENEFLKKKYKQLFD